MLYFVLNNTYGPNGWLALPALSRLQSSFGILLPWYLIISRLLELIVLHCEINVILKYYKILVAAIS